MNSLRASNTLNRSRSARNVMARALPILERGGSTRNFRELPPDRRRGNLAQLESQGSARNLAMRRRSNSTRRFFVTDQNSRGGSTSSSSTTAASLTNQFRRVTLERTDSNSSMGSFQSWGSHASTMCSNSYSNNGSHSNNNTSQSNNDSVLSVLSIDSTLSMARAPPSVTDTDDEMMSLYSRDSVKVRHNQLEVYNSSNSSCSALNHASYRSFNDDDMLSLASSDCTIFSFDRLAISVGAGSALGPMIGWP